MVIFYFLHYMLPLTTRDLIWEYVDMVVTSRYFAFRALITQAQPPPQALRFLHRRGERETWVTGDEPLGTMGWVQTAGPLSPSCLPLRAHFHRERETSGYEADASANLKSGSTVKPSTSSRVCITVLNSPNPSRFYIRLCKHWKRFLLLKS